MLRKLLLICIPILILAISFLGWEIAKANNSSSSKKDLSGEVLSGSSSNSETPKELEPQTIFPSKMESKMLFFGDVFWGRYVEEWAETSSLKTAYPFSGLNTLDRQNYQAWIGSLNCPITDKKISAKQQDQLLQFNCRPEYLEEARKWFDVFSLSNSHTDNMDGIVGFDSTKKYLSLNGFQYFGHYDKTVENDICEVVTIPIKVEFSEADLKKENNLRRDPYLLPVAFCGYHNTFSLPTDSQLAQIQRFSKLFPTFSYAIQGLEYPLKADGLQEKYYRAMIDQGADSVIGKSAHVVQNTEVYKGKLILYSLGNFIYDQQFSADVTQGIGLEINLVFSHSENLEKWQKIAESCFKFKDNCLLEAETENLTKIEFEPKFQIIATDNSGKLVKKASPEIQNRMIQRTNWAKTLSELQK